MTKHCVAEYRPKSQSKFHLATAEFQEELVYETLKQSGGNVSKAAKELGISRTTIYNFLLTSTAEPSRKLGGKV